jgi:hypothetical protein
MNFSQSYTKVQYSMDTSLIKNKREFARRMYLEGMKAADEIYREECDEAHIAYASKFVQNKIAEESNGST